MFHADALPAGDLPVPFAKVRGAPATSGGARWLALRHPCASS